MKLSIIKLETDYVLCEGDDQKLYEFNIKDLPPMAKFGDILEYSSNGCLKINSEETNIRKNRINKLQNKLFR